jgi:hypothetical protein
MRCYKWLKSASSLSQRKTVEAPQTRDVLRWEVHKKTINYCGKETLGCVLQEGKIGSSPQELDGLVKAML